MLTIDRTNSALLLIDFQSRLMPAIEDGAAAVANARQLLDAARLLDVPVLVTEQYAKGLGPTVPELDPGAGGAVFHKTSFDACRMPEFLGSLPNRPALVVAGCETHVCVLQTALGLLDAGRQVFLVRDAVASRRTESKEASSGSNASSTPVSARPSRSSNNGSSLLSRPATARPQCGRALDRARVARSNAPGPEG
jgi:nicotinamidase-related amidase